MQYMYAIWHEVDADRENTHQDHKIDYIWATKRPLKDPWGDVVDAPSNHRMIMGIVTLDRP
jgi:hypothetical protein